MSSIQETRFSEIANAIRGKTGRTAPIAANDFASEIGSIETGGGSAVAGRLADLQRLETVHIPHDGQIRTFTLFRQNGAPNANYVGWGNCTFLIQTRLFEQESWGVMDYSLSNIHLWLHNIYIQRFPMWVQSLLVQGRIPFRTGEVGTVISEGENGALVRAFMPSQLELGLNMTGTAIIRVGTNFDAFISNAERIALGSTNNTGVIYGTRTLSSSTDFTMMQISVNGASSSTATAHTTTRALRPVIALPPTVAFDNNRVLIEG
jgi:hypothetical protein